MVFLKKTIKYSYLIFLFFASLNVYAQNYSFRHFSVEEGLPSSEVFHVFQDTKGFIWFATDMGVCRYNGKQFANFDMENGLTNNAVFEIFEDKHEKIWFLGLSNKLSYFHNHSIIQYKHNDVIAKHTKNQTLSVKRSFFIDSVDNVYLSVKSIGMLKISAEGIADNLQKNDTSAALRIFKVSNRLLVGNKDVGKCFYDVIYNNIKRNKQLKKGEGNNRTGSAHYFSEPDSRNETALVAYSKSIFKTEANALIQIKSFNNNIIWFSKDKHNRYWVSVKGEGIYCFKNDRFSEKSSLHFLKNHDVSSVLVDQDNGYWFSTLEKGVFYLPTPELKTISKTIDKNIYHLSKGNNNILVGTLKPEILVFDKNLNFSRKIELKECSLLSGVKFLRETNSFLIASNMFFYDLKSEKIDEVPVIKRKHMFENSKNIKCISADPISGIWAGGTFGILKSRDDEIIYNSYKADNWHDQTHSIVGNSDGSLWLGTFSGLWKYKDGEYVYYGSKNDGLKQCINSLLKHNNKLFIGTKGAGLLVYNLQNDSIKVLNSIDGLSSNSVTSMAHYKNNLWVGTNKGISIISLKSPNKHLIAQIHQENGLLSDEINLLSIHDSILYIATKKGVNYLNPDKFNIQNKPLNTCIEKVRVGGVDTLVLGKYKLNHRQNFINIKFNAISFKNNNILYRYKMHPIVAKWIYTNNDELQFTSLDPGEYKFTVSAKNQSGEWNNEATSIDFIIRAPFWEKWWFITLVIILSVVLIVLLVTSRMRHAEKENELREKLNLHMKKSINSQINPHFLFNSLNSINHYILKNDKINSSKYLNRFSIYIRSILKALENDYQSLSEELKISKLYLELEKFRLKEKLFYTIKIDKSVNPQIIQIPPMLIIPFLENAIWLGILPKNELGKIMLSVSQRGDNLIISVKDDGVGRKKAMMLQSEPDFQIKYSGSKNALERIKLLNNIYSDSIEINYVDSDDDSEESGTTVNIIIKINRE